MATQDDPAHRPQEAPPSYRELPVGTLIELNNGARAEVIGNPGDGAWLLVKILESPDDPSEVGTEDLVFFADVKGAR